MRTDEQRKYNRDYANAWRLKNPERYMLRTIRRRCRVNNLAFDLTVDDLKIPSHCPVLGIPLVVEWNKGSLDGSPSVDRHDPTKGYTKDNVCVISMRANRIKNNASPEELERVLAYARSPRH